MTVDNVEPLRAVSLAVSNCDSCPFAKLKSIGLAGVAGLESDQEWVCAATKRVPNGPCKPIPSLQLERESGAPAFCPMRVHRRVLLRWVGER